MPYWLDTLLVLAAIVAALGYFVVRAIRRRRRNAGGCASDCGCSSGRFRERK